MSETGPGFRIAVLASGGGTNLQAIIDQAHGHEAGPGGPVVEVVGVGSDQPTAGALERAREADIPTATFPRDAFGERAVRDEAIADWLEALRVDLVVLAGYMQLLSADFISRFAGRVINIHPALLPSFPGLDAIGQALEHGVSVTGVTVHFVDDGVDSGPIIVQRAVEVPRSGNRQALEEVVRGTEHGLYPEAIRMIAQGRVSFDGRRVRIT